MWAGAAALVPDEVSPEVYIRLVLIVGPAAQRDIACLMLSAPPIRRLVMVLHATCASATTTLLIDECATTTVALPYLASDGGGDGAGSAIVTSLARLIATSIVAAGVVGDRSLLLECILE